MYLAGLPCCCHYKIICYCPAMQAAIERHAAASTDCSSLERQVQQLEWRYQQAAGGEAEARAGANAAVEQQAVATEVQKCTKQVSTGAAGSAAGCAVLDASCSMDFASGRASESKALSPPAQRSKVEALARELSQCHRTQQPAVAARLRDARQQLQEQQQQAEALRSRGAELRKAAQQATADAEQALQGLQAARAQVAMAASQRAQLQQEMRALMEVGCQIYTSVPL